MKNNFAGARDYFRLFVKDNPEASLLEGDITGKFQSCTHYRYFNTEKHLVRNYIHIGLISIYIFPSSLIIQIILSFFLHSYSRR